MPHSLPRMPLEEQLVEQLVEERSLFYSAHIQGRRRGGHWEREMSHKYRMSFL